MERRLTAPPRRAVGIALLLVGGLSVAAVAGTGHGFPLMSPDSGTYINWDPSRTPLYPLILWIVGAVSPDYGLMPWLQYAAMVLATVMFSTAVGELLDAPLAGGAVGIAVFANFYLMRYASTVLTDSLFLSLVMVHCACALRAFYRPGLIWPLLAGAALSCAILVRPAGYALLFAVPFLPLIWRGQKLLRGAVLAAACVLPILIACTGNYLVRGYFATQAFGGINLALQTATLMPPQLNGLDTNAVGRAYSALEPARQIEARAESWPLHGLIETVTFNSGLTPVDQLAADIVDADPRRWQSDKPYWRDIAVNAVAWQIATKTIGQKPVAYLGKVARQFYGMWFVPQKPDRTTGARLADILHASVDAATADAMLGTVRVLPGWQWAAKMLTFGAMLAAAVLVFAAAPFVRDKAVPGLAYLALATFCYFGVTAGVEVAIPRYSLMAWPEQCAILIGVLLLAWRYWTGRVAQPAGAGETDRPFQAKSLSATDHAGSPERFGYEWNTYSGLLGKYQDQFRRWTQGLGEEKWKGARFLDVGCGMGRNSYWAMQYGAAGGVAVDLDERSLAQATRNLADYPSVTVQRTSAYDLDFTDAFDIVFSIGVIHHLEQPELALSRMLRAAKPGGTGLIWVYGRENNGWIVRFLDPLRKTLFSRMPIGLVHLLSLAPTAALWIALRIGLDRIEYFRLIRGFSFPHLRSIVFDQMLPRIANYWAKDQVESLMRKAGFADITLTWVNEMSWTAIGTKPKT